MTRIAVVTGGARGLGLAIARLLADRGHALVLVDRDDAVRDTAEQLRTASAVVADLTADEDVRRVRDFVRETHGSVDVLVNNAGITRDARLATMAEADFTAVVEVNLLAAMRLTFALEAELRDGSSVVNMSSRAALGNFGQANYVASKSGLIGFTRGLALRWSPRVRVNAVAPGLIDSPMSRAMPPRVLDGLVARIPAGRIGEPEDVAKAVAFLASDDASYITGQVLTVCGGRSIAP
ncbi:3-oxoacyl-ACP reductase FabG [Acrocarpospora macrocephala]|uniref:Beta-ketoacyl-ACP reductase n=1 Tax=Acrocarpospora macrocephala TaxID=150177 RepID=A0A5M3WLM8_9ACTN|nr:SDR family oxidoreductase [Acrocarpospora macrocephala]GES07198.1 beta-ketoacyl-ACP reductase [Acrocarpospora macrocephala]